MYDDSYVPGFEDSEAVSAHGEGGGGGVGVTAPVPRTLPPVQDFEERLCGGAGHVVGGGGWGGWRSSKVERWMFMPEASRCPRPRARSIRCVPRGALVGGGSEQVAPQPRTEGWREAGLEASGNVWSSQGRISGV